MDFRNDGYALAFHKSQTGEKTPHLILSGNLLNGIGRTNRKHAQWHHNFLLRQSSALIYLSLIHIFSGRRVEQIMKKYLSVAGLDNHGYTPHKLRHTAATLMYQYGGTDILILQRILGHSNLSTTEIYTHAADDQVKHAADSSPLADFVLSSGAE